MRELRELAGVDGLDGWALVPFRRWVTPADLPTLPMILPTVRQLEAIARFGDVAELLAGASGPEQSAG